MQTQLYSDGNLLEKARYFEVPGAHLYTVVHEVGNPLARILLVGPFASERHYSYVPWVRWARYLAAKRIEVLRYDYRGVGESTGIFEEMTFQDWIEDVQLLGDWFSSQKPAVPLILHGLELGALLAARSFQAGRANALLLWAPPASANQVLRTTLLRRVRLDQLFKYGEERKTVSDYIQQLDRGLFLDVEGYQWSGRLWYDSFKFELPDGIGAGGAAPLLDKRPVRIVSLDRRAAPLVKGGFAAPDEFNKDFSWLFADNLEWINTALSIPMEGSHERGD